MNHRIRRIPTESGMWLVFSTVVAAGMLPATGCSRQRIEPVRIANPALGPVRVAVAPALNFSGSTELNEVVTAEIMASELAAVDHFEVLPVSRVLAVLASQGLDRVQSPAHAIEIARQVGADAVLLFGITEYDPYEPPVVGIAAQLYGQVPRTDSRFVDPVVASRSASPVEQPSVDVSDGVLAQASEVYNADHQHVREAIMEFARLRNADDSAWGWRKYTVSQRHYLRFVCHATIRHMVTSGVRSQYATAVPTSG